MQQHLAEPEQEEQLECSSWWSMSLASSLAPSGHGACSVPVDGVARRCQVLKRKRLAPVTGPSGHPRTTPHSLPASAHWAKARVLNQQHQHDTSGCTQTACQGNSLTDLRWQAMRQVYVARELHGAVHCEILWYLSMRFANTLALVQSLKVMCNH